MSDSDDEGWGSADSDKYEPSGALKFMTKKQRKGVTVMEKVSPPAAPKEDKADAIDDLLDAFQELEPSEVPKKKETPKKKEKKVLKKKVSVRSHIPKRRTSGSSSWLKSSSSSSSEKKTSPPPKKKAITKKKKADPYAVFERELREF